MGQMGQTGQTGQTTAQAPQRGAGPPAPTAPAARKALYVAHARQDEAWVQGVVLPALGLGEAEVGGRAEDDLDGVRVEEIAEEVQACRYTLLVASGAARADQWVQLAAGLAEVLAIEEGKPRLLVMARDFDPDSERARELLPLWQRALAVLDCSTEEKAERGLARLAAQLRLASGGAGGDEGDDDRGDDDRGDDEARAAARACCPYPGLRSFGAGDPRRFFARPDLFFGRDAEATALVEELRRSGRALLLGPSGSGKSSLWRARVMPALGLPAQAVATVRPGARPDEALRAAVAALDTELAAAVSAYVAAPRRRGASEALLAAGGGAPRLLVIDPFDEVLTARAGASEPSGEASAAAARAARLAAASAQAFLARLAALAKVRGLAILVVLRSDFYPELMRSPAWGLLAAHRVELLPLRGEALRQAIVRPAERCGVHVEVDLVERLVREADEDCAAEALPLLQVALEKLWAARQWRYLSLESYQRIAGDGEPAGAAAGHRAAGQRGLEAVLARHADESLAAMSKQQQLLARRVLLDLVHFGEGRPHTRRRRQRRELDRAGDAAGALDDLLDALAERRLIVLGRDRDLVTDGGGELRGAHSGEDTAASPRDSTGSSSDDGGGACVDLAHDALLTGWAALAGWLREYREALLAHRRLEARAEGGGALTAEEHDEWAAWLETPAGRLLGAPKPLRAMMRHSAARRRLDTLAVIGLLILVVAFALSYREHKVPLAPEEQWYGERQRDEREVREPWREADESTDL